MGIFDQDQSPMEEEKENTKFRPLFTERVPSTDLTLQATICAKLSNLLLQIPQQILKNYNAPNIVLFIQNLMTPDDTIFI